MGNTNSDNAPPPIIIEEASSDSLPSSSSSLAPRQNSVSTVDPARITPILADRMALLAQLPQFGRLPEQTIFNLAELMREVTYTDAPIFNYGDESNEFFIVKEGTVSCCKPAESSDPAEPPADTKEPEPSASDVAPRCEMVRQGECFGDSALINNLPRTFSASAVGAVVCCVLDRASFQRVFAILDPANLKKRRGFTGNVGKRLRRVPSAMLERRDSSRALSLDSKTLIARAIAANQLLSKLDDAQKEAISVSMWSKRVQQGQPVITQGDEGDAFYVIDQGEFRVTIRRSDGTEQNISTLRSGASFGEMALLYNAPRSASITAATDGLLWSIDRFAFQRIIAKESRAKLESVLSLLGHVKTFSYLAGYERTMLAEAFEEVSFRDGQAIYETGDPSNTFFVVKEGLAVRLPDGSDLGAEFGPYTHFGEAELLEPAAENGDRPVRSHTVRAKGPTVCLRLDDLTFDTLLAPLDEVFRSHGGSVSLSVPSTPVESPGTPSFDKPPGLPRSATSPGLPRSVTSPELAIRKIGLPATMLATRFSTVKLSDLDVVRTLGRGSFGVVKLVRHKESGELFALKKLSKRRIREMGGETQVISETQVMAMLDSPFLCKLYASFQDRNCVYMLMETCLGGDIYNLLQSQRRFTEDTARFYAACTVLAIEGVHNSRVIYRDLKPENLLLDRDGYVKLIDFGFAKVARQGRTWTVCGTPEYMAPEQLMGTGHSESVDWWALGVFIFEMLAGYTPFRDEDPSKVYSKIANYSGNLWLPVHFSVEAKDIIRKFLDVKPLNRLGSGRNGLEMIKGHAFFRGIDWINLKARLLPSPYLPPIDVAEDGSGFDLEDIEDALVAPQDSECPAAPEEDNAFKDFSQVANE